MSILIKGMEMPINCKNCRFWYQDQDSEHNVWNRCTALNHKEIITFITMRRADCPLIEVPPHGRLIDADELKEWSEIVPLTDDGGIDINDFDEMLVSMPTIIEAEEGTEI